jgi:glycosyltransferase involved in cell wall biosynthesis
MSTVSKASLTYSSILCTFNAQKTVKAAIESILKQTIKPADIIIVDDASRDKTIEILQKYVSKYPEIKLIKLKQNKGQSATRNIAAKYSTGDILIFFDDDDISLPERAAEHLKMNLSSDISYTSSQKIYNDEYKVNLINNTKALNTNIKDWIEKLILGKNKRGLENLWIPCSTCAIDRKFFVESGGFSEDMRRLEDVDFFLKSTIRGAIVSWSSKILVLRRNTYGSDKGGTIDCEFEKKLILKYKSHLGEIAYRTAIHAVELRKAYFSKNLRLQIIETSITLRLHYRF